MSSKRVCRVSLNVFFYIVRLGFSSGSGSKRQVGVESSLLVVAADRSVKMHWFLWLWTESKKDSERCIGFVWDQEELSLEIPVCVVCCCLAPSKLRFMIWLFVWGHSPSSSWSNTTFLTWVMYSATLVLVIRSTDTPVSVLLRLLKDAKQVQRAYYILLPLTCLEKPSSSFKTSASAFGSACKLASFLWRGLFARDTRSQRTVWSSSRMLDRLGTSSDG